MTLMKASTLVKQVTHLGNRGVLLWLRWEIMTTPVSDTVKNRSQCVCISENFTFRDIF